MIINEIQISKFNFQGWTLNDIKIVLAIFFVKKKKNA